MTTISRRLNLLVMIAVIPSVFIIIYSGLEQKRQTIETARKDVTMMAHAIVEVQNEITGATRQTLATLAIMPEIRELDIPACNRILKDVTDQNTLFIGLTLTDVNGQMIATNRPFKKVDLSDRKHIKEALQDKRFTAGEYIVTKLGSIPSFAFAYPILNDDGEPVAVINAILRLDSFSRLFDLREFPEKSFLGITDFKGTRVFYHPQKADTNPIGKQIKHENWLVASTSANPGVLIIEGSDGVRRLAAYEQVRLDEKRQPYMYVWVGIPEKYIIGDAYFTLGRNLFIMFMATAIALFAAKKVGHRSLIVPLQELVSNTRQFAEGKLETKSKIASRRDELGALGLAFNDMAETIKENQAHLRALIDSMPDLVWLKDANGVYISCNRKFESFFGAKEVEIVGKTDFDFVDHELAVFFREHDRSAIQAGKPCMNEEEVTYASDRHSEILETIKTPIFDDQKKVIGVLGVGRDISERKRVENELAEEKELLRVTLRSIGDAVITTDIDGRIVLINKVAEQLTGWSNDDAEGRSADEVFRIVYSKTGMKCESPVKRVLQSGKIITLDAETLLIAQDGSEIDIADSAAPIRDSNNVIIGVVIVFRDIRIEKQTEKELLKMRKLESVGVLAGGIAHDFNNILAAIQGNIELVGLSIDEDDENSKLLQNAEKAIKRAAKLTRQLLTFSRGGEPVKETASFSELISEAAEFVLHGSQVHCEYDFQKDLWQGSIDSGQISQVVQNIVINGMQAMPDGGRITIACRNAVITAEDELIDLLPGDYVCITIEDTGEGIEEELLDKIFDPYFSTKQTGSGLGLSICHSIVKKHGGLLTAHSAPGMGARFVFYLPADPAAREGQKPELGQAIELVGKKILLMDDDELVVKVLSKQLILLGCDVLSAADGEQAIRLYKSLLEQKTPVDLAIMDLTIPGMMGGKEAAAHILQFDPKARLIVASGYSNDPVMGHYKQHGFCAALAKPFDFNELKQTIISTLSNR